MCPFVDESNPRCAVHLSLRKLTQALGFCADRYEYCAIYHTLLATAPPKPLPDGMKAADVAAG